MRLIWSEPAVVDLQRIREHIERDNPGAARAAALRIIERVGMLPAHPALGRPGRIAATRELVVTGLPYVVVYQVREDAIVVLRALHGARRWPERIDGA